MTIINSEITTYQRVVFEDGSGKSIIETINGYKISGDVPDYIKARNYDNFNDALDTLFDL